MIQPSVQDIGRATPDSHLPRPALVAVIRRIDRIAAWSGEIFCWLIVPLVAVMAYEVIARYAFGAPTIWAFDVSFMLYGSHFMLGAAYTLLRGGHIRTDIFYMKWRPRTRGIVDAVLYLFVFFPAMVLFFWMGLQEALHSFAIREVSGASPWRPIIYPFRAVIPIAVILLLVQGISELLKSLYAALEDRTL
jgi:TRAP-type mannitol/chloroaromatic compound transport system permease small subunit